MAIANAFFSSSIILPRFRNIAHASVDGVDSISLTSDQDPDYVPMPIVLIDQDSDSDSTIVQVSFGDRLGALIDTMKALKDLGLDVAKGTVTTEGSVTQTKFFITRLATGRKVEDPDLLERIRLTIINNLLKYHPESSERLAMGEAFGIKAPAKKLDVDIATHIHVRDDGPKKSLLCIETADRPGLLLEIIKIMADINGLVAKDKFHVSYRGAALNSSLSQVLVNCLRYYLRRPETDEDILASDPDSVHDFCIPNTDSSSSILPCKNSSLATVEDFVFSGVKNPGKFRKSGFSAMAVTSSVFPGLNTLGVSLVRADFDVGGINVPHFHPRATEIAYVLEGRIYSGFVDSENQVFAKVIEQGEVMVFPKGLVHFQMNVGKSPATILGSFNSQNPGLVRIPLAVFGSEIKEELLEKAFGLNSKEIGKMRKRFAPKG
ncbi:hypothetical protein F0562_025826 [Nyssa sinensis]|uniref:Nectarin-1 n=1 Tax=Nyssa sinensis TaxID=561372 RepID=A0A5J5B938_9ASTE|nr:hypothetical protein F0562_025826 [Nyssa sinensis]